MKYHIWSAPLKCFHKKLLLSTFIAFFYRISGSGTVTTISSSRASDTVTAISSRQAYKSRHASATALLRTRHWLPVKARIQYKIACLCYQCICQSSMQPYISDLHSHYPSRMPRSLDISLLTVPRFSLETFGKRSLFVFGHVWNSLPLALRKTQCFTTFTKELKTHLFQVHLC